MGPAELLLTNEAGLCRQRGFTLVEMVTVILVLGVLALGVSSYVIFGTRIFVESSAVAQVTGESRYAMERLTREIRSALPGSPRLATGAGGGESWQCLELVPIVASSRYLFVPVVPAAPSGTARVFSDGTPNLINAGQWAFVYPLTATDVYGPGTATSGNGFLVKKVMPAAATLELEFAQSVRFRQASPSERIFFTTEPVSYCVVTHSASGHISLWRYAGYGFDASQPGISAMASRGQRALMAQHLTTPLPMALEASSLINNAVIKLDLGFEVNGEQFNYQHQVQVVNVP